MPAALIRQGEDYLHSRLSVNRSLSQTCLVSGADIHSSLFAPCWVGEDAGQLSVILRLQSKKKKKTLVGEALEDKWSDSADVTFSVQLREMYPGGNVNIGSRDKDTSPTWQAALNINLSKLIFARTSRKKRKAARPRMQNPLYKARRKGHHNYDNKKKAQLRSQWHYISETWTMENIILANKLELS